MSAIPIVMTAFGTTTEAVAAYASIEEAIERSFPDEEIIWTYSSRAVTRTLQVRNKRAVHLQDGLAALAARGIAKAVVQSLHLFPGSEFHRLVAVAGKSGLQCSAGAPLLTAPEDYEQLGRIIEPIAGDNPGQAILVLGHGTDHPIWTAYYALEKILRRRFGKRLFVGVVEKYPTSDHLPDEIAACGFTEAVIVPLFLVGGMHVQRDIIGEGEAETSWMVRLRDRNITATCYLHGLVLLPGLAELIIRHITEARKRLLTA